VPESRPRSKKTTATTSEPESEPASEEAAKAGAAKASASARAHVCPVAFCPIGMALTSVQQIAPDVLDHLLAAGREFLLAAKAVVDARAADFDGGERQERQDTLERIEIG